MNKDIFYNNNILNKNKIQSDWVLSHYPNEHLIIMEYPGIKFSEKLYNYFYKIDSIPICNYCRNKPVKFRGFNIGYDKFCSHKCSLNNPDVKEKRRKTTFEKWGVEHTSQLNNVKEKQKKTNLEKYGGISPTLNLEVKSKQTKTMLERYGVEYSGQSDILLKKSLDTRFDKYREDIYQRFTDLNIKEIVCEGLLKIECDLCNKIYEIRTEFLRLRYFRYKVKTCTHCNPIGSYSISNGHQQLIDYLISLDPNIKIEINNRKVLDGLELDIYLPDFNLGIEYNGVYWHSELHKTKTYHIDKYKKSKEVGIDLIQIWEDTLLDKFEIIKSILKIKLGIVTNKVGARKCDIKEISSKEANEFLENNHLQGSCVSTKRYGLYYGDILVSVATFGKGRVNLVGKKNEWEILRLSTKRDWVVSGGLLRLFNHFISDIKPGRVISYSDNDLFTGGIYQKLGMVLENDIIQSYTWSDGFIRKNRWNFRKDKLVKEGADKSLTEVEIMHDRGWFRCFSSGQKKWILNL